MCVYTESKREELQHQDQQLPKIHTAHPQIHNDELVHAKLTRATLNSCSQSHCMSGQLLSEWKRTVARDEE